MQKSAIAIAVKAVSAPLAFMMLVTIARSMSIADFGAFSFAFALVIFLAKVATVGQPQLLLRELGARDKDDLAGRNAVILFGYGVTLAAGVTIAIAVALAGALTSQSSIVVAALLVPLMAINDLQTSILRANGSVINAMAPREIGWRLMVICAVFGLSHLHGPQNATQIMVIVTIFLLAAIVFQACSHPATRFLTFTRKSRVYERTRWLQSARYYWTTTVLSSSVPHLTTIIVGLFAPIEAVGPFFAAFKAAQLLNIVQLATNVIAAPVLARCHATGETTILQRICSYTALAAAGSAFLGIAIFFLFGGFLLQLFGHGFQEAYPQLLVMSVGYAVNGIFGQNGQLLQMAGQERHFMKIVAVSNVIGLALSVALSYLFGTMGAAIALSLTFAVWNAWAWHAAIHKCGVDTSVFGATRLLMSSQ